MPRYALLLAYDGTGFAGWWRQPGARTVGGEVDAALARLGEPAATAIGASRTDSGVHARGQVAHIDCARAWEPADLARALARQLPDDVACRGAAAVAPAWHAAHDATGKTYRYRLHIAQRADPFLAARIAWRPPFTPALARLRAAAAPVAACGDFTAFARRGEFREDLAAAIEPPRWYDRGGYRVCRVRGSRFTYRLVRSLVGGMIAAAHDGVAWTDWLAALEGRATPAAQQQAPARGLCLERVHYAMPPAWG